MNKTHKAAADEFAELLAHAIEAGEVSRKELAIAAKQHPESIRRMLEGQPPRLAAFRRMVGKRSALPLPLPLKQQLLDWLLSSSCFAAIPTDGYALADLDANGDGRIDALDTLAHQVEAVCHSGEALRALRESAVAGDISPHAKSAVHRVLHNHLDSVRRAIASLGQPH